MLFVVFVGRAGGAVEQVRHAADEGARAASMVRRSAMRDSATSAVARDLTTNGANCSSTTVSVEVVERSNTSATSTVTVTVACVVEAAGTGLLGTAMRTVTARSTEIIDRYRAG